MIDLLLLIPVYQREEVRRVCFEDLIERHDAIARKQEIALFATHIESAFDGETLGTKLNRGLAAKREYHYDYYMVLGSDDLLRPQTWGYIRTAIDEGIPAFGFNQAYLYDRINHKAKIWDAGPGTFGAGRCVRRDIVEACGWEMWDNERNNGIDNSQERILLAKAGQPIHIVQTYIPVICDIKDEDNLNSFDDVPGLPVNAARVRELFPALREWLIYMQWWKTTTVDNV